MPKWFISHDATGRIISSEAGPPEMEEEARGRLSQGGRKFAQHEGDVLPDPNGYYVKNGKVIERPELVPGDPVPAVINLNSPDELPDLPKGAMVMLDNFALETMESRGRPSIIGEGNETVHVRIDAFPAKPAFFNVAGATRLPPNPSAPMGAKATKRKAPAKSKAPPKKGTKRKR